MMAVDFTVSYGPRRNHSKYFLRWVDVLLTCLWACTSVNASYECVCARLSATHAACGSYVGIVRTRQGALLHLCLPGAAFHPRREGERERLASNG